MTARKIIQLTLLYALCNNVYNARILGIFPMGAPSHYILGHALMRGLAEAGHNVTMISPFEDKIPPGAGTYRDVVLTGFQEDHQKLLSKVDLLNNKNQSVIAMFTAMLNMMSDLNDNFFAVENVQNLLESDEKFDVVIIEQFMNDAMKIFGHIYNIPVIIFSPLGANPWINNVVGNPTPLSYLPLFDVQVTSPMTFLQRFSNVFSYLMNQAIERIFYFPSQNRILKKYFTNAPNIFDIYDNVQLALLNSHESLNQAAPYVPNMVQIGGFHVKPPKKLPKDLQEYLDSAKDGVVYFSLGSNLKSKNLPPHKKDAIVKALSKLKQKVLWKWEDDNLPGKPPNVKIAKWLPQQDILAHPNVKLFITHCGLLSTIKTVYHGVPMLAIPVFGDQHQNAISAVNGGYALALPYEDESFSEEKLSELLNELLTNPKYTENVKKRSTLLHDRPIKPLESAIYWVEFVVRYGGAPHLRVAGVGMPWYKYHSLDVVSFIVILTSLVLYIIFIIVRKVIRLRCSCKKTQRKSKKE